MRITSTFAALVLSGALLSGCCFTGNCPGEVDANATSGDLMEIDQSADAAQEAAARAETAAEKAEAMFHRGLQK